MTDTHETSPIKKPNVYSGMEIGNSENRATLVRVFDQLPEDQLGDLATLQAAGAVGISEIVERGNFRADRKYRCIQYAFGTVNGERWANPSDPDTRELFEQNISENTRTYLNSRGYDVVDIPQPGDVIGYARAENLPDGKQREIFEHFGIYNGLDVISKFASGHVYRHDLNAIAFSTEEVNEAVFFRKKAA